MFKNSLWKRIIALFLFAVMVFQSIPVYAMESADDSKVSGEEVQVQSVGETGTYGDYQYTELDDTNISITQYKGTDTTVNIPSQLNGFTVQVIGDSVFKDNKTIEKVVVPESVLTIEANAFQNCTALEEVVLPDSIETMGYHVFENCTNLVSVNYPKNWVNTPLYGSAGQMRGGIFYGCSELTAIDIPEGATTIPAYAFSGCKYLTAVTLPDSLTEIGKNAFESCTGLTEITLPKNIAETKEYIFSGCTALKKVSLPEGIKTLGAYLFSGCSALEEVVLPDSIETMGYHVFENCKNLESVNYPKNWVNTPLYGSAGQLGGGIFYGCVKLTTIEIPEGATTIPAYAFSGCKYLTDVTLPEGLTEIGKYAFDSCTGLTKLSLPESLNTLGDYAYNGCTGLTEITMSDNITEIKYKTFSGCTSLTKLHLSEGLKTIYAFAFSTCSALTEVILPDSIETMGYHAFENCSSLVRIGYPKNWVNTPIGLGMIGNARGEIFYKCSALELIEIPEGVTIIPTYAFSRCAALKEVVFPKSLTEIGSYAFNECTGLTEINLPSEVEILGERAFKGCANLKTAHLPKSVEKFGNNVFEKCSLLTIYCPYYSNSTIYAIDNNLPLIIYDNLSDTASYSLSFDDSYYYSDTSGINSNGYVKMTTEFKIKESEIDNLSGKKIVIRIPTNAELKESTLTMDGNILQNYVLNDKVLTIPVEKYSGKIEFYVCPTNSERILSYSVLQYTKDGEEEKEVIGIVNEPFNGLTISCDDTTSKSEISVSGVGPKSGSIELYLDDVLQDNVSASKTGKYSSKITLSSPENGQTYIITAKCTDGENEITAKTKVLYEENIPELTALKMYYNDHKTVDLLNQESTPYVSFSPNSPFTFTVDFTNKEEIDNVYIVSSRNNQKRSLEAEYDEKTGLYIATGYFDESNRSYVPGKISVDINRKHEQTNVTDSVPVNTENISEEMKKTTVTKQETGKDNVEKYTFDMSETFSSMYGDTIKAVFDMTVSTYDNLTESEMKNLFGYSDIEKNLLGYVIPGLDDSRYFATSDFSDPNTWAMIVKDGVGAKAKYIKLELCSQPGNTWTKLDENAQKWSDISKSVGVITDILKFGGDYEDLKREIMQSSTITDKNEALKKAKQLFSDQAAYTILAASLPVLALSGGMLTGPVAIGFTALMGIIGASSDFFWNARIAQIKGESLSVRWIIDPSGYVYEGVLSNRLEGVKTTAYYKEKLEDTESIFWNASEYDQVNPLYTDGEGMYAWDVPEGFWQVKYEFDGYETAYSEWMEVPPPRTNVNIEMIPIAEPSVSSVNVYKNYIELRFNQYLDPETVLNIKLTDVKGQNISYELEYSDDEVNAEGKVLAKEYRLKYSDRTVYFGESVKITIPDSLKAASGKNVKTESIEEICKNEMTVDTADQISIIYGENVRIPVAVQSYDSSKTITVKSDCPDILEVSGKIEPDANGNGYIDAKGLLPGETSVTITVDGTSITKQIHVTIIQSSSASSDQYLVTYAGGVGTVGEMSDQTVKAGEVIQLPECAFSKEEETFIGWSDGTKMYQPGDSYTMPENQIIFVAVWQKEDKGSEENEHEHAFGDYQVTKEATVFQNGEKKRTCEVCGESEIAVIAKLNPTIKLNAKSLTLKVKQSTTALKVSGLAKGDKVASWKSSNTSIVKVSSSGKITAQKKTGKATITVTLASKKTANITVKVQKGEVKTTKISGLSKKLTLKKGGKVTLKPVISPITSVQKITYSTSNKKVATVSKKGMITAKKKGTAKITVKSGSKKFTVTVTVK